MYKLITMIALLMGSAMVPIWAQKKTDALSEKTGVLDSESFKKDYSGFIAPTTLEVKLSKGNVLLLKSATYSTSKLVQRPDSLVRLFWEQYGSAVESLPETTDATSLLYILGDPTAVPLRWKQFSSSEISEFAVLDNELVKVKTVQDTLRIMVWKEQNKKGEAVLLVNNLRDIPMLFDEIREKTAYLIERLEKKTDPDVLDRSPEVYGRYLGERKVEVANFGSDMLILGPGASLGYIRGNWMTSLNADLAFYFEKSSFQPRFSYNHQYFFDRTPEGKTAIYQNGFVSAGLSFFSKSEKSKIGGKNIKQSGQLMLGYQVVRNGDFYEENTWRISSGLQLTTNLKVEPEVYFNGFFKNLSPGVRLTVGF